ncbi:MAG: hypothetical protein QOI31_1139 [Solirubrobacterales bacterium]|nr:hypothetical protein [Solirubrobacterales bacterium]
MKLLEEANDAFAGIEPEERVRLARLGSLLFMVGSLTAIPAGLLLEPQPQLYEHVVSAAGFLLGLIAFFLPWERMEPGWLHFFPVVGALVVVAGVAVFSVVFSFFLVLAGMFVAISVRKPIVFSAYMAYFVLALLIPFAYTNRDLSDQAIIILATLPVLFIVAYVSRYMHEVVEQQKEQYRVFASQAIALGERIKGNGDRIKGNGDRTLDDSPAALERRLKNLTLASSRDRRDWSTRPKVWPPSSN